jgi:Ca2+-binding EF-hand superfamily protein
MKCAVIAAVCVVSLGLSDAVLSQTAMAPSETQQPVNMTLLGNLTGGSTLERYLTTLRSEFARLDGDGNGTLEQADFDLQLAVATAVMRGNFVYGIMFADLDGDGAVTEQELRQAREFMARTNGNWVGAAQSGQQSPQARLDGEIRKLMSADTDKDGRITWIEASEFAKLQPELARPKDPSGMAVAGKKLLELAAAGKASLTWPEVELAARALFHRVDSDGNGTISLDELDFVRKAVSNLRSEKAPPR